MPDRQVEMLENAIRSSISIPLRLQRNIFVKTTGLGGVFIEFYSNTANNLTALNSQVQFKISFDTTDNAGRYQGEAVGVEMYTHRNIPKVMRSIKTKKHYTEVVSKVNKWLEDNEEYLVSSIVI